MRAKRAGARPQQDAPQGGSHGSGQAIEQFAFQLRLVPAQMPTCFGIHLQHKSSRSFELVHHFPLRATQLSRVRQDERAGFCRNRARKLQVVDSGHGQMRFLQRLEGAQRWSKELGPQGARIGNASVA